MMLNPGHRTGGLAPFHDSCGTRNCADANIPKPNSLFPLAIEFGDLALSDAVSSPTGCGNVGERLAGVMGGPRL